MGVHYKRIDDFFRLDPYQLILQLFNLLAIFTMLSNVVFNVFAAAPPIIEGCSQSPFRFNGTISESRCVLWKEYNYCEQPDIHFQFKSVNVEFHSYCGVQEKTWLDTVLQYIGVSDKAKFSTTLQMLGVMFSCLYAGQLSDILTPVFIVECLPPVHRFWICTVVTWAPNYLLFSLAAYLTSEWRSLARVSAAVNLMAIIILLGVLRWTVGATVACLDHFGKNHIGRIRLHIITFGFVTLCLAINFVIFILGMNHEMEMVIRSLALLSFGVTGCLFLQSSLSISELFPTAIRSLASSHSNVVGRLGNVMSPLVFGLDYFPGLPYLILAILGVIDVILYFISIPETKGCPLPNEMPTNKNKLVLSNL
uniref:Uncharacterized protein n=1 Tax=Pristionchus pacificus TaxID=54126 RepID=A0A2A6CQN4_PRIPA|eukprot:PDM80522.1 hypothetical protein PRIPAC_35514 [Pristionchus pacificus]